MTHFKRVHSCILTSKMRKFLSFLEIDKNAGAYSLQIYDNLSQIQCETKAVLLIVRHNTEGPSFSGWQLCHCMLFFFVWLKNRVNLGLFFKPWLEEWSHLQRQIICFPQDLTSEHKRTLFNSICYTLIDRDPVTSSNINNDSLHIIGEELSIQMDSTLPPTPINLNLSKRPLFETTVDHCSSNNGHYLRPLFK